MAGRANGVVLTFWLLGSLLLAFVLAPLLGLAAMQPAGSLGRVAGDAEVWQAIGLSLLAAFLTTALAALFGVPLAYVLARGTFLGRNIVAAIVDLPLAVPHTVAGIALLFVFGRRGWFGAAAADLFGLRFWGTLAGVVVAMLFFARRAEVT